MTVKLQQLLLAEASAKEVEAALRRKFPGRDSDVDAIIGSGNPPLIWPVIMKLVIQSNEPIEQVLSLVASFNRLKQKLQKKDLAQYKNVQELQQAIESLAPSRTDIKGQVEKIYEDEHFVVVYPHSREASCVWGKGTTWCTARTQSVNYFPYYTGTGVKLYYLITKGVDPRDEPKAKLSIGFDSHGEFSGGKDGGLSVDANNQGITMSDVIDQLQTRADPATTKKIIAAVKTHVSSSGDHPMKGFYDKILVDPAAHKKLFTEAYAGESPEPYVAALIFADDEAASSGAHYPQFVFDMCVYLNQMLIKFGVEHEAFQELMANRSLYSQVRDGLRFPEDIDRGLLSQYIQDAMWLVDLEASNISNSLKAPVITNVDSINAAIRIIESGTLNESQLLIVYFARFLDQNRLHQIIRDQAMDSELSDAQRAPYMLLLELQFDQPGNSDAWTEAVLFKDKTGSLNSQLAAWVYNMDRARAAGVITGLSAAMFTKVITEFITPNIAEILDSNRVMFTPERLMGRLVNFMPFIEEPDALFDPMTDLFFLLKPLVKRESTEMYSASDQLIRIAIDNISSIDARRLASLIAITPSYKRPDYRISDILDYVAEAASASPDQKLVPVMRQIADIARSTYTPREHEQPSYAASWWNSPVLPPEYVPMAQSIRQQSPQPQIVQWPWPPPTPQQPQTLAELLFRRR